MKITFAFLLLLILLLNSNVVFSQPTFEMAVDSMENELSKDISSEKRVDYMLDLAGVLMRVDTVKSKKYAVDALNLSQQIDYQNGEILSLNWFARFYTEKGQLDTALVILDEIISKEDVDNQEVMAQAYISKGNIYDINGSYPEALEAYFESEKRYKEVGNLRGVGLATMGIGNIYQLTKRHNEAIRYFRLSANCLIEVQSPYASWSLNNMAEAMESAEMLDSAAFYYNQSLVMKEQVGDFYGASFTYTNLGNLAERKEEFEQAEFYYKKALEVKALAEGMSKESIGKSELKLGEVQLKQGKTKEALQMIKSGLLHAKESGSAKVMMQAYQLLANGLYQNGNFKEAYLQLNEYTMLNDSLNTLNNAEKLAELQTLYETAEKDAKIASIESENMVNELRAEKAETESRQANTFLIAALIVLILLVVAIIFAIRIIKERKRNNEMLTAKNSEITKQKEIVEEKSNEILDSINYAKRIQSAILPPMAHIQAHLNDFFVLYKPKDIVAGDFYWMESRGDKVFLAAADCTGHGVPGAMVSVICNNGLNRAVREHQLQDTAAILNKTREIVVQEFEKSEEEVKDGMDIALVALQEDVAGTIKVQYSGANNPLWVIRKGAAEIEEIKADKQPIGKFREAKDFSAHEVELKKGDRFYIFSDGFADQFGGDKGKKFKSSNLKKLLLQIQDVDMQEQNLRLDRAFEQWKGELEQLDDVCFIGVSV